MTKLNDKWLRIIGVPIITLVALVIYHEGNAFHRIDLHSEIIHSVFAIIVLWELNRMVIITSRNKYPGIKLTRTRIAFLLFWTFIITIGIRFTFSLFYSTTKFWGYHFTPQRYIFNIIFGLVMLLPILAIYEAIYLYKQWWKTYYEAERLKKENLQTQLDSLKSQIQPHFLFNNLSTLSSLVAEDPKKAERFIEELSSVYRYLLQNNDQPLTTLENELNFIDAYFHLLQTRFGNGLRLIKDIPAAKLSYLIPPLTLQLLVENAVKHNAILSHQPLKITIYADDANDLFVVNNLQVKSKSLPSDKTGLANISSKYSLLGQPHVVVRQTEHIFQVKVPLINPSNPSVSYGGA
ncbi:sensor histidine kinase [Runella aurantiaca]|uniref:Histidine kinase n=1 Tax=Runella aurantiaca TaxID=2282308 RepID=A0A369IEB4_9BACT|nr:histidine kinase [Runella aurantiaca]RDB08008.1 histidine kinase [Runella aurantiaca]